MLGLGDRGGCGEGGGEGVMNESFMDGYKGNGVISTAYKCLLLWPISIVSGAFERTGRGTKRWEGGDGLCRTNAVRQSSQEGTM